MLVGEVASKVTEVVGRVVVVAVEKRVASTVGVPMLCVVPAL